MKYLYAYAKAFSFIGLGCACAFFVYGLWSQQVLAFYFLYLAVLSSVAGIIGEFMKGKNA